MKKTLCLALVVCFAASIATGGEFIITGNGRAGGDVFETMIASNAPVSGGYSMGGSLRNYGALSWWGANELAGPNAAAGANTRGLIRFDVSDLTGLTEPITSIEMRFYQYEGVAATVDAHVITGPNSNWQAGEDTGSYTSWPRDQARTTWSTKLNGLGDGAWYRFDFGWEQYYGVGNGGFYETEIASTTTTGSGWQSMFFTGNLDGLIADWALSPRIDLVTNPAAERFGIFAEPEEFTVVDNPGLLIVADGPVKMWSSDAGWINPDGYPDGELINPDGYPDGELIDPDGEPDSGDEFIAPDDSFIAPDDTFDASLLMPMLIVTTASVGVPGDFDDNGFINAVDIDILCDNMASLDPKYDLDDGLGLGEPDGDVDEDDLIYLIESLVEWDNGVDSGEGTKQGDFNLDGVVNATDLAIMKGTFGASGVDYADGNANCDDVVNATDLAILKGSFGFVATPGGGVPEPMTIGLLSLGGLGLLRRRR